MLNVFEFLGKRNLYANYDKNKKGGVKKMNLITHFFLAKIFDFGASIGNMGK
jgi:hypothetical protein